MAQKEDRFVKIVVDKDGSLATIWLSMLTVIPA